MPSNGDRFLCRYNHILLTVLPMVSPSFSTCFTQIYSLLTATISFLLVVRLSFFFWIFQSSAPYEHSQFHYKYSRLSSRAIREMPHQYLYLPLSMAPPPGVLSPVLSIKQTSSLHLVFRKLVCSDVFTFDFVTLKLQLYPAPSNSVRGPTLTKITVLMIQSNRLSL